MSFDSLVTILNPPSSPVEGQTQEEWFVTESRLGTTLPSDYQMFIDRFGTGCIAQFIWILNPAAKNRYLNLIQEMQPILGALKDLRASGEPCPFPLFPERGGLLPFGKTDNGDALYWLTEGKPDEWPVVVNAARDPTYEKFDCGMAEFLTGVLSRRLRCSTFPQDFPSEHARFVPVSVGAAGS